MDPREELKALQAEAAALKAKGDDLTQEDIDRVPDLTKRIGELETSIAKRDEAARALAGVSVTKTEEPAKRDDEEPVVGSIGQRFVKSDVMKGFREANPRGVDGKPVSIKAGGLGSFEALIRKADPSPLSSALTGAVQYQRLPGILDLTYSPAPRLLDLITRGTTNTAYVEYRQLTAVTEAAAIVAEGATKPLSTLTTAVAQAAAYTYADGVKVTNQELADDGIIASLIDTVLRRNLLKKMEDIVLNGTGTNQPKGILHTTGVLTQAFATDMVTTIRKAITLLEDTSEADITAVVLNSADSEALDLLQDDNHRFYGNGPFGTGPNTIWGRPVVVSNKITAGTAVLGDFTTVQLLDLDGITVEAFNQNEDDARKNLTYIRAENRALQLIREPAKLAVATIASAG